MNEIRASYKLRSFLEEEIKHYKSSYQRSHVFPTCAFYAEQSLILTALQTKVLFSSHFHRVNCSCYAATLAS